MPERLRGAGDPQSLIRLMIWLSPSFPVGGFAYSGGLEAAAAEGHVSGAGDLTAWLEVLLGAGSLRNDAILLAEAHRAFDDTGRLSEVAALAAARAGSAERYHEAVNQGDAFLAAASAWPQPVLSRLGAGTAYSVAVGAVAAANGVALAETLLAFLQAQCAQLVSAAIRLGVIGQRQAVAILAWLEGQLIGGAGRRDHGARGSRFGDGARRPAVDAHETQYSRLFQS
jgi:urease accessory protein